MQLKSTEIQLLRGCKYICDVCMYVYICKSKTLNAISYVKIIYVILCERLHFYM